MERSFERSRLPTVAVRTMATRAGAPVGPASIDEQLMVEPMSTSSSSARVERELRFIVWAPVSPTDRMVQRGTAGQIFVSAARRIDLRGGVAQLCLVDLDD